MPYLTKSDPSLSWRANRAREQSARDKASQPRPRKARPKATPERMEAWRDEMRAKGYVV